MKPYIFFVILGVGFISNHSFAIAHDIIQLQPSSLISKDSLLPRGKHGKRGNHGRKGHRGREGQAGENGPTGATGATGLTGAQGATGATGGFIPIYGSVVVGSLLVQDLPNNAPVPFIAVGPLNGVAYNGTDTYTILTTAVYRVSFILEVSNTIGAPTAAVNLVGVGVIANTTAQSISPQDFAGPLAFQGNLLLNAGDQIQVINTSGDTFNISNCPGCSFNVLKVGTL